MLASFFAGLLGSLVGVGITTYLFFRLYKEEKRMAEEMTEKFLSSLDDDLEEPRKPKKGKKVDFLSLIKDDSDKPIN
jgi:uncharacterized membrane protein YccC